MRGSFKYRKYPALFELVAKLEMAGLEIDLKVKLSNFARRIARLGTPLSALVASVSSDIWYSANSPLIRTIA